MLYFKSEIEDNIANIREVLITAFGRKNEAENFIPELSLVACENEEVLGHILFSPIIIESQGQTVPALALVPLAVKPICQRQSIGSQLVEVGLRQCRELERSIVVVLGDPSSYKRFGFQTASNFGVDAPFPIPDDVFMVLELKPGALRDVSGTVRYPAYFDAV